MVSFHTLHPVEVQVRHKNTRQPAADALVTVNYSQRPGYGVFYVLRVPKDTSARTDDQGIAHMRLADFANHRMAMRVNGDSFFMTNELVFKGGTAETPADYFPLSPPAKFTVSLTPENDRRISALPTSFASRTSLFRPTAVEKLAQGKRSAALGTPKNAQLHPSRRSRISVHGRCGSGKPARSELISSAMAG